MKTKNLLLGLSFILTLNVTYSQTPATGVPAAVPEWYRGGNLPAGSAPIGSNIFGTIWNSPIYTVTFGINRTKLNGSLPYGVNGLPATARNGFFLLGPNSPTFSGGNLYDANRGAFSLFHLNGDLGFSAQEFGHRNWMRTGITFTDNNDRAYIGYKANANDVSDMIFNWSDNSTGPAPGPDNLLFVFTSGTGIPPSGNLPDLNGTDDNGREVLRMTGFGNVGIGPRFDNVWQPASTFHQHQENSASSWFQITNQRMTAAAINPGPTAIGATNGIRLGIFGSAILNVNGIGMLYNQENRPLLFSTGAATNSFGGANTTSERVRIMAAGTVTQLAGAAYGVNNPGGVNPDFTRMSISHNPLTPVTRPLSLLHLGYNTTQATNDGWRPWMDVGMFVSYATDNMYIGMKREGGLLPLNNRMDAVVGWGDNTDTVGGLPVGPDNLRFIFTSPTTGIFASSPASQADGLETGRFVPDHDTTFTNGVVSWGRFGVGDFSINGVNQQPTHKLDVIGNGRFRYLPDNLYMADASVTKVVMVDSMGVLRWANAVPSQLGQACGDTTNPALLTSDREVPMNDFNIYFSGQGTPTTNAIGVGYGCTDPMPAKFNVKQNDSASVSVSTAAGYFQNTDTANIAGLVFRGVVGIAAGPHPQFTTGNLINVGGEFVGTNAQTNFGVRANANFDSIAAINSYGGRFSSIGAHKNNVGAQGIANNSAGDNYGVQGLANNTAPGFGTNFGGHFSASGSNLNYGIYATVQTIDPVPPTLPPASGNYAGYFNGSVLRTGNDNFSSDSILKTNVDTLHDALAIIEQLKPRSYYYDTTNAYGMVFSTNKQYGFVAQHVETVLPELVSNATHPATYDTLGNVVTAALTYKTLQYQAFIALLTKGLQEQQGQIDSIANENEDLDSILNALHLKNREQDSLLALQDSVNQSLQDQINTLYNMITACCSNGGGQGMQNNNNNASQNLNATNVELKDVQSVVLDQNVPNPFAEQTTITYTLPTEVKRAQMLFYNAEGKLINTVDLSNQSGKGQINVFANDLSNGIYTYTLIVDGKIIDTKKMVKQ